MELWRRVDAADRGQARALLRTACGASQWIDRMLARRPFGSSERALAAAREEWFALEPGDWREAFDHHPRIGDVEDLRARFPATAGLSAKEQAGVAGASDDVLAALAAGNRAYEEKFGYIFIVCATGRTPGEMLALLQARLGNDSAEELRVAAEEQAKITGIRLLSA